MCKQTNLLETDSHEENRKHAWGGHGDSMLSCESVCFVLVAFPYNSIYFGILLKKTKDKNLENREKAKTKEEETILTE